MNEERRIQEMEWRIQGLLQEYADLEKRLKLLETVLRAETYGQRIDALEQAVNLMSKVKL